MENIYLPVSFTKTPPLDEPFSGLYFCGVPRPGDAVTTEKHVFIVRRVIHESSALPLGLAKEPHLSILLEPVSTLE